MADPGHQTWAALEERRQLRYLDGRDLHSPLAALTQSMPVPLNSRRIATTGWSLRMVKSRCLGAGPAVKRSMPFHCRVVRR
jgi:hypothetical protein